MAYPNVDFFKFKIDDDLQSYMGGEEKDEGIEPDDADSLAQSKEAISEEPGNVDSSARPGEVEPSQIPLDSSAIVDGFPGDAGLTPAGIKGDEKGDPAEVK